jgi:hypothetical protein
MPDTTNPSFSVWSAGEISRLEARAAAFEAEHERFRAQAEAHFAEIHERNMRLAGKVAALKNANDALTVSLKLATREIERLRGLS